MELRHFRYYVAVAEALSFRRAAEHLRVAQPALSKQIREFEEELGVKLLNRNTAGVSLTDAGAVFLDEARDILERVEMAKSSAHEAKEGRGGRLTIATLGAVSSSLLPDALTSFRKSFPRVEVELQELSMPAQIEGLVSGKVQLGFGLTEGMTLPAQCTAEQLLALRLLVAVGRSHRLARRSAIALADLDDPFICLGTAGSNDMHAKLIERILEARNIKHRRLKRVNGLDALFALVASGHGVSLMLPIRNARLKSDIVLRPVKDEGDDLVMRVSAVWKKGTPSQLTQNFLGVIREQVRGKG